MRRKRILFVTWLLVSASAPALAQLGANFLVSNNGTTAYVINGAQNPTLSWNVNHSYTLQINAPPNDPFRVQTTTGIGATVYPGCSPQDQITGLITCAAPSAGTTLFYQCQNHPAMHGNIMVNDPPTVSAMGRLTFTLLVALVLGTGLFFLRQRRQRV